MDQSGFESRRREAESALNRLEAWMGRIERTEDPKERKVRHERLEDVLATVPVIPITASAKVSSLALASLSPDLTKHSDV